MRSFLLVAAAVLLVVGAAVGITAATTSASPPTTCYSVRLCSEEASVFGFGEPVFVPRDSTLRFVAGGFSRTSALDVAQPRWFLDLLFDDSRTKSPLVWIATPWLDTPVPVCLRSSQQAPSRSSNGVTVCAYTGDAAVGFWTHHVQYVAYVLLNSLPPGIEPSVLAWLVREASDSSPLS